MKSEKKCLGEKVDFKTKKFTKKNVFCAKNREFSTYYNIM